MTADLTPEQAARLARMEAAPAAPESAHVVEAVARAMHKVESPAVAWETDLPELCSNYRRLALAAVLAYTVVTSPADATGGAR